jgi:hypothetical protein
MIFCDRNMARDAIVGYLRKRTTIAKEKENDKNINIDINVSEVKSD